MQFSTPIQIPQPPRLILPSDRLLFIGSCFADGIGQRMRDNAFNAVVNPYGTMYNPVSVRHAVERALRAEGPVRTDIAFTSAVPTWLFITLGTNHVYRLRETGEVVDNCEKRPQKLFKEETLSVSECAYQLQQAIVALHSINPEAQVVLTVSPIRYAKYGFHESQLSKATLLLAVNELITLQPQDLKPPYLYYFPAYELLMDELRDYRFYKSDMLHPSDQAVDYIWQRMQETMLAAESRHMISEWQPIRQALNHRPLHPESEVYRAFITKARQQEELFNKKYHTN